MRVTQQTARKTCAEIGLSKNFAQTENEPEIFARGTKLYSLVVTSVESAYLTPQICGGQPLAFFYAGVFLFFLPSNGLVKFGSQKLKISAPYGTLKLIGVFIWRNK